MDKQKDAPRAEPALSPQKSPGHAQPGRALVVVEDAAQDGLGAVIKVTSVGVRRWLQ